MSSTVEQFARPRTAAIVTGVQVATMWILELIDVPLHQSLNWFGVHSWRFEMLWTLFTMPFAHTGFDHLIANSLPLIVLGFLVALEGMKRWITVTLAVTIGSGLLAFFLNAPGTLTIGASGVVFGYLGYLLARGLFARSVKDMLIMAGVGIFYGGMLMGILPTNTAVSWQGHLGGLLAGGLIAWWLHSASADRRGATGLFVK